MLRGEEELAAVEVIGREAGQGEQQDLGPERQRHDDADRGGVVVRQLGEYEPVLADALRPGAHGGDDRSGRPDAVVEGVERPNARLYAPCRRRQPSRPDTVCRRRPRSTFAPL